MRDGNEDAILSDIGAFVKSRQYYQREPQRVGNVVSQLLARSGYAQVQAADARAAAWKETVDAATATQTRVGQLRRGVLQIHVSNSALVQELAFQKTQLIAGLQQRLPALKLRDISFRVGSVN